MWQLTSKTRWYISKWAICDFQWADGWRARNGNNSATIYRETEQQKWRNPKYFQVPLAQTHSILGDRYYIVSQEKLDPFLFEHNFGKYCPILIFLSLLQTEINCDQT